MEDREINFLLVLLIGFIIFVVIDNWVLIGNMIKKRGKIKKKNEFTIEDAREIIKAWESLEGGINYKPKEIQNWLINDMKPVIDKFRSKIAKDY
jgi:hypothetical protein